MDNWEIELRHCLQPCLKIGKQIGLVEQLRAIGGKMLVHNRRQHFRATQPAAQADKLRQFFIVHLVHRLLHAVLSAVQFLAHVLPFALVCPINDRFRMRRD